MDHLPTASFDLSPYYPLPQMTTLGHVALSNALLDLQPPATPDTIDRAARALESVLENVDDGPDVALLRACLSTYIDAIADLYDPSRPRTAVLVEAALQPLERAIASDSATLRVTLDGDEGSRRGRLLRTA